jgi:hypothetical protein
MRDEFEDFSITSGPYQKDVFLLPPAEKDLEPYEIGDSNDNKKEYLVSEESGSTGVLDPRQV